ncbi:hypothetical protein LTR36_000049 [Oleoguttula mirabilis]|uniref:AB hydrolase-1 domain-containing protein n=1 Tax=Oleoguttula mirabilis TaxID=1507867 RepID=A0AAV9JYN6_9PEZI|nr:hypothetical protein LTR36_000049 [Oleoguttula mirabilis]
MKYTTAAVAALAAVASARQCQNITVPVQVSARNGKFNQTTPVTDIDVEDFILNLTQQGTNYTASVLEGYQTVSGNYSIAATYCTPDSGPAKVVQVLTHGIGFDRSYWDLSFNNYNYSYVKEAVEEYGYSTFSYDRLGIGMSSHGEAVNEIQALLEVDALRALTEDLRNGIIPGVSEKYGKVVHVGHSFGSQHSYALTAMYPNISDGIVLTGFSQNGSFGAFFELGSNFIQANTVAALSAYPNGYLASGNPTGVQNDFFSPGMFDPAILTLAYNTGKPVTVGELLTFGGETGSINHFCGPTLIITGARDIPYCGGNCLAAPTGYTSIPETSKNYLPNAKNFEVIIVPEAGHGLNLQYSHPFTYSSINNYLVANGLAANSTASSIACSGSSSSSTSASASASTSKVVSASVSKASSSQAGGPTSYKGEHHTWSA